MKKLIHAVLLLLGGLTLILSTSVAPAHAGVLPLPGPEQDHNNAINSNSTEQSAYADATTKQANFNVPVSVLSFGSNNGDVQQSNQAGTQANAENANATNQGAAGQQAGPWTSNNGRNDNATNDNRTKQESGADAFTKQVNVNAPISVLSYGSNNGNVDQSNKAYTNANAENDNSTQQSSGADPLSPKHDYGQQADGGQNSNHTDQQAYANAFTKQVNVNAPISVLSYGSNNGNVDQSNKAYTSSNAENDNSTKQNSGEQYQPQKHEAAQGCQGQGQKDHNQNGYDQNGYDQNGYGQRHDQAEPGSNKNDTNQRAYANAYTKQQNFNTPVSILSFAASNGNVHQSNNAYTNANAENLNSTYQKANGPGGQPANDYGRNGSDFFKDGGKQFNSPSNQNQTEQHATAKAKTEQKNVNFPISFLSFASNNGNVQQHNSAVTQAFAGNGNWTGQSAGPVFGIG